MKRIGALFGATILAVIAAFMAIIVAIIAVEIMMPSYSDAKRSVDSSNLRQIGQASLIFASDSGGRFPVATTIHEHAAQLALKGGLNDPHIWLHYDAHEKLNTNVSLIWDRKAERIEPDFARITPSFAVVSGLTDTIKSTTPLAWTRGLLPSGKWSVESPYFGDGGHIAFVGGNVSFFRDLSEGGGQLHRFDGKGMTADIREALPPEARILNNDAVTNELPRWALADSTMARSREAVEVAWLVWVLVVFGVVFVLRWRALLEFDEKLRRIHYVILLGVPFGLFVLSYLIRA